MAHHHMKQLRRLGLMLGLIFTCGTTQLAGAGTVPPIPTGPLDAQGNPATPDYYTTANWANSPPLAKFVNKLPGLGFDKRNELGQYLTVAKPDTVTYPGTDYYEIDLVQYRERMHSDLPAPGTLLRGYVQVNKGTDHSPGTLPSENKCGADQHPCTAADNVITPDPVHYLGPNIISERDRPVRLKFTNKLPVGEGGDLFIPVDTTVMGAGTGPAYPGAVRGEGAPCDNTVEPNTCASYAQNRADIHLHGGRTPWISDGTPHQWITPKDEVTPFTKGVSLQNVPDMPDPGDGASTYYFTNQQSARLMFYHDHAFGITRLNVYAGEVAGYVITDGYEQDLVKRGIIPADQIPLIIQDKTFVDATPVVHPVSGLTTPRIRVTDPLWNWGSGPVVDGVRTPVAGDLWLPHVYMPAQTLAAGFGGVNPFGRWMYGPWFYPATDVVHGPVANPYYDADCSSPDPAVYANCATPGQPELMPGTPNVSMGMEAFQDSAVVNGTVFPTLTVDPRAYRFRVLNGASDRFWNLSFYEADSDPAMLSPDPRLNAPDRSNKTEVKVLPASADLAAAQGWPADWPVDGRDGGVPDPALRGPSFLQIGTEGGFLPQPVEIQPQPIVYYTDPTAFWVGTVDKTGLALGPAERADVIVDFSQYAGKTLILYNDAPAAWPARVPGYDYFTGAPDLRDSGGYGTGGVYNPATGAWDGGTGPLPGYAPNTRTVMQVIVRPAGSTVDGVYNFDPIALAKEFTREAPVTAVNPAPVKTLFERAQEPIIVGQSAYGTTYPDSYFPPNFPWEGISQINDNSIKFVTLAGEPVVVPMEPKGIHDEMGSSFDPLYGRMSGNLAMQLPNPTTLNALLVLYGFSDLPTETVNNSTQWNITVVPDLVNGFNKVADGTQIWKISHNGVDTHPIHFHIFDVQLVNRVGWDGQIRMPDANELGWKDTVKISPLMDTIVAVRPRAPALPFGITNSLRPLNPAIPLDSTMGFNSVDWQTGEARPDPVTNILYNFGWEYVWHCHILSHEEMDMMRPIVLNVVNNTPDAPTGLTAGLVGQTIRLDWTDPTPVNYVTGTGFGNIKGEIGFRIEKSTNGGAFEAVGRTLANATTFTDAAVVQGASYTYRVVPYNAAGDAPAPYQTVNTGLNQVAKPSFIWAPATSPDGSFYATWGASSTPSVTYVLEEANNLFFTGAVEIYRGTALRTPYMPGHANGTWYMRVKAIAAGMADSSYAVTTGTTVAVKAKAPTWVWTPATSNNGTFYATWGASATAGASYIVEEANNQSFTGAVQVYSGTALRTQYISGHANGTWYVRVKAVAPGLVDSDWKVSTGCVVNAPTPTAVKPSYIWTPATSANGSFYATWGASTTPNVTYVVEEANNPSFTGAAQVYSGIALRTPYIPGHATGTWYMRVKATATGYNDSTWAVSTGCTVP